MRLGTVAVVQLYASKQGIYADIITSLVDSKMHAAGMDNRSAKMLYLANAGQHARPSNAMEEKPNMSRQLLCLIVLLSTFVNAAAVRSEPSPLTKLDSSGKDLPDSAVSWSCVRDNLSGLMWEVKTADRGLHDKSHTYTWYNSNPDNSSSSGTEGDPGDTTCGIPATVAAGCDTEKFVAAVNAAGWCGKNDWRMPTVNELNSIVDYGSSLPALSRIFFPDLVMPAGFWSASPYSANTNFAWIVIFDDGYVGSCVKSWAYYVRLVRGGS